MTSPTKGILEVNDELCRILGYERSELLQMTWAEMTHPDDLAADVAQFNRVMAGEIEGYSLDKRWIRKDGRVINSIMAAKCLRRADGSVDYFVGLVLDITERKRAEERIRELGAIVESSDDAILGKTLDGIITSWNKGAEKIYGYAEKKSSANRSQFWFQQTARTNYRRSVIGSHWERLSTILKPSVGAKMGKKFMYH